MDSGRFKGHHCHQQVLDITEYIRKERTIYVCVYMYIYIYIYIYTHI